MMKTRMYSVSNKQQKITPCLSAGILIHTAARHHKIDGVATGLSVAPAFIWSADVTLPPAKYKVTSKFLCKFAAYA
jgi:hypothetical protein